jgi:UDP-2,3-diacylglucosamine hydrolase
LKSDAALAGVLRAPAAWRRVALVSDLHLGTDSPRTTARFLDWLQGDALRADALFVLGDLFESWIGDDLLSAAPDAPEAVICAALAAFGARGRGRFLGVLVGNRDFLLGAEFAARCGAHLLPDPCRLEFAGQRIVLSHGDALCLADTAYLQWRALCRQPAWQAQALAQPLERRREQAAALREQSRQAQARRENWADADPAEAARWLTEADSAWMIHGHTHRPCDHWAAGRLRQVLCDWDLDGPGPRAQALWLSAGASWVDAARQNLA